MRETSELLKTLRVHPISKAWKTNVQKLSETARQEFIDSVVEVALGDPEKSLRTAASKVLKEIGGRRTIKPLLNAALSDVDKATRARANNALKEIGGEELIGMLMEALNDDSNLVRARAARMLGRIPSKLAALRLAEALDDKDDVVRADVSQALKRICNQEILRIEAGNKIVDDLVAAIDDEQNVVRIRIVDTLKQIGGSRALNALKGALRDKDGFVRAKAAYALGFLQSNKAWKDLAAALADQEVLMRANAAEALGKIGDRRAVPSLIDSLADPTAIVRAKSAWSLGRIGFNSATSDLIKASRDSTSPEVRANATLALGQIAEPRSVFRIAEAARDDNARVREHAVEALGRLGRKCVKYDVRASEHAITALVAVLKSERTELHDLAAEALRQITDNKQLVKQALTALVDALQEIGREKALLESRVEREGYIQLIYESVLTEGAKSKGKALETLLATLFSSIEGFVEVGRNLNTHDEEIDIVYRNESQHPTWQKEGSLILIECKNWLSKRVGKNEFVAFEQKIENRAGRCRLGFLICVDEFADTVTTELLRFSKTDKLIVPINGDKLRQLVRSQNRNQLLIDFVTAASLT